MFFQGAPVTQPSSFFCHQLTEASVLEPEKSHNKFKRKAMASAGAASGTPQKGSSLGNIVPSLCLMPIYLYTLLSNTVWLLDYKEEEMKMLT